MPTNTSPLLLNRCFCQHEGLLSARYTLCRHGMVSSLASFRFWVIGRNHSFFILLQSGMVVVRANPTAVWSVAKSTTGDISSFYMVVIYSSFVMLLCFLNLSTSPCFFSFTISLLHYHIPYSFGAAARSVHTYSCTKTELK